MRAAQRNARTMDISSRRFEPSRLAGPVLRWSIESIAAISLMLGVLGCSESGQNHDPVRRVILISCDTLRADRLGMYGYERDLSPNLDRFAGESVVFERAYATAPHTNPALSSLLTSRMPDELGVSGGNRSLMPSSVTTLPELLAQSGIPSAAIVSNWALRRHEAKLGDVGIAQGFDHFDDKMGSSDGLRDGHFERIADATTDAAIGWLEQNHNDLDRYFLWVHYQDPHGPYTPPEGFRGMFTSDEPGGLLPQLGKTQEGYRQIPKYQIIDGERRPDFYRDRYDEEIRFFDDEVGRLLDWLESRGAYEDTLVVFTADHGESLGEHQYWFTHEANLYDEEVRVPLVIRYPKGLAKPSGANLVGHLDFLPSVLDAFGLPEAPARGVSLIARSLPSRRILPQSLHKLDSPLRWFALTDERYRLVIPGSGPQLYDLRDDPGEQRDLAADNPKRIEAMIENYREFMAALPKAPAVEEIVAPLDEESRRALEALGYLEPSPDASNSASDPPANPATNPATKEEP